MCQNCLVKTIHSVHSHFGWDNSFTPVERVAPGTTLEFECHDSSNGHFTKDSVVADVTSMPFDRINPVSGPVFVEGAMPGDVLKVTIDSFKPSGFGWTANIPGFGLLADQFLEPALALWQYDTESLAPAAFGDFARIPLKPFAGTIGVAPAESGLHSVVPPRRVGGNLDIRDLAAGTTLALTGANTIDNAIVLGGDASVSSSASSAAVASTLDLSTVWIITPGRVSVRRVTVKRASLHLWCAPTLRRAPRRGRDRRRASASFGWCTSSKPTQSRGA